MRNSNDNIRHVKDQIVAAFTSAQPQQTQVNDGFPTGNEGILALHLNWKGTFNTSGAAGAAVADGPLKLLRSINLKTNKHKDIIRGVDGVGMHRMLQFAGETRPASADCASNADGTTFKGNLVIPFADMNRLVRPYDAMIDMGANAIMDLKTQFGVVTDVQSAGADATVNGLRQDVDVEVLPGIERVTDPESVPAEKRRRSEMPNWLPVWEALTPVTAAAGKVRIQIPTGDRVVRRIHLAQYTVDATTGRYTEVSSIVADTGQYLMKIGKDVIVEPITHQALNAKNKTEFRLESMPAGWATLAFDRQKSVPRMLDLYQYPSGITSYVEIDVLTVATGVIQPYMEYFQLIPPEAIPAV